LDLKPFMNNWRYKVVQRSDQDKDNFTPQLGPAAIEHIKTYKSWMHAEGGTELREVAGNYAAEVQGNWAEFGVERGDSAHFLSNFLPENSTFYLFDSWQGLPEEWVLAENYIRASGQPASPMPSFKDPRLVVVPGWFEDTLPKDMGPLAFVHIDCDLYSSTKTVLERTNHQIFPGTIMLFDELWGYPNWREHEYKALVEWGRPFEWLARDTFNRALIRILE